VKQLDWEKAAFKLLQGRTITHVRYAYDEEMESLGWTRRPIVLMLDDGNLIYPSMDDEGNDAGSLFTNDGSLPVIPVL
jgi:hypothetical protein